MREHRGFLMPGVSFLFVSRLQFWYIELYVKISFLKDLFYLLIYKNDFNIVFYSCDTRNYLREFEVWIDFFTFSEFFIWSYR